MSAPTAEELRYPFLYRYFKQIPEAGKFTFLDSGWMEQTCKDCLSGEIEGEGYIQRIDSIRRLSGSYRQWLSGVEILYAD